MGKSVEGGLLWTRGADKVANDFDGNRRSNPRSVARFAFEDHHEQSRRVTGPPPDPPIQSNESLPDLGDANYVWRGDGQNTRGVIKVRAGRFLADVNAPSVEETERLARRVADLLCGEPIRTHRIQRWTPHLWASVVPVVLVLVAYLLGLTLLGYNVLSVVRHWFRAN